MYVLTARSWKARYENAARSLTTSPPAGTVTERSPPKVTAVEAVAIAAPSVRLAIVVLANVTGALPKRFERCTRTVEPPSVGGRIARTVAALTVPFRSPDGLNRSLMSVPGEESLGTPAHAATQPGFGHLGAALATGAAIARTSSARSAARIAVRRSAMLHARACERRERRLPDRGVAQ